MTNRIKELRARNDLTQSDLARKVGVRRETIVFLEKDKYNPSLKLAYDIAKIAGKDITLKLLDGPLGVEGRNSDNKLIYKKLGWEPTCSLEDGLEKTDDWILKQVNKRKKNGNKTSSYFQKYSPGSGSSASINVFLQKHWGSTKHFYINSC